MSTATVLKIFGIRQKADLWDTVLDKNGTDILVLL